jgi:cytochrome c oxidase assembly protein subunit 15
LGKTVVDSNLAPFKITIHMVMAMVIVAIILYLIYASKLTYRNQVFDMAFRNVILVALTLSLVQIVLGTQVRQHIDERVKDIGYIKSLWMENPTLQFYVHRSFSVVILVINGWLFFRSKKLNLGYVKTYLLMLCILAEIISGIAMFYFDFPFLSQPLHLVIALIMFGIQFYIYLESKRKKALLT